MEVKTHVVGDTALITVHQLVKSSDDVVKIERDINGSLTNNPKCAIEMIFEDAFVIPSMLIETLVKHAQNHTRVTIVAKDHDLFNLLQKLKISDVLKVTKH